MPWIIAHEFSNRRPPRRPTRDETQKRPRRRKVALVESDRHAAAFFELVMLRAAGVSELDAVRLHRREIMTGRIEALSATLSEGAQEGRIREDLEPDAIARHIASVQYGVLATWIKFGRAYSLVDAGRTAARLLADAVVRRPRARRNR